jgi:hypothetical protein
MLTAFAFEMPRALNVERMPPKLTASMMSMSVEGTHHELETQLSGSFSKTAAVQCSLEGTSNVIGTPNIWAINIEEAVNYSEAIFGSEILIRLVRTTERILTVPHFLSYRNQAT